MQQRWDELSRTILSQVGSRRHGSEPDLATLRELRHVQWELYSLSEEKMAVADQATAIIDAFLKRIETDLEEFEAEECVTPALQADPFASIRHKLVTAQKSKEYYLSFNPPPRPPHPGESVYCYCQQISHGKMIGCEGNNCRYEWFHIRCLGLKREPRGDFYCDECGMSL